MVAHAYNISYLRGGDQKDHGLRPAPGKNGRPIQKITKAKKKKWGERAGGMA
jgi:hypothetical protein